MYKLNTYFKYPRTLHLPWSLGISSDDKTLEDLSVFEGKKIVITEKMDGENTSMYRDHIHARSIDSKHHPSRNWVKSLHGKISHNIPEGWRLCGENLYARHSLAYAQLESYFYLFSIWDENNICLSWNETISFANKFDLSTPNVLYEGLWNEEYVKNIKINQKLSEGYVVRIYNEFHYDDFNKCCAKWVRQNHIQCDDNWMHQLVITNDLKSK